MPLDYLLAEKPGILYAVFTWAILLILFFMAHRLYRHKPGKFEFDVDYTHYEDINFSRYGVVGPEIQKMVFFIAILVFIFCFAWFFSLFFTISIRLLPLYLHSILETFSIVVASMFFGIVWHTYEMKKTANMLILTCAFFISALIDIAHMLSYDGMPEFITASEPEKAINFWLTARFVVAIGFLAVAVKDWSIFLGSWPKRYFFVASVATVALVYWLGLYHQDLWPIMYVHGKGLTHTKIFLEYVIIAILLGAAFLYYKKIIKTSSYESAGFFMAIVTMILSEMCFTSYARVDDLFSLLGHLYKVLAYYFIYRASFVSRVQWPFWKIRKEIISRKKSEQEATKERDFTNAVFDTAASAIVIFDTKGNIKRFNKTTENIIGYSFDEIKNKSFIDIFIASEERVKARFVFQDILNSDTACRYENYWLTKNGQKRLFEWSSTLMCDEAGQAEYIISIGQDITERRQTEDELGKQRARLRAIFDTMSLAIGIMDKNGYLVDCNVAAEKLLGITKENFLFYGVSKDDWVVYNQDMKILQKNEGPISKVLESSIPVFGSVVGLETKDSGIVWGIIDVIPLEEGGVLVTFNDITKLRDSECKQSEQEKLLMQQAKLAAMGEMVGAIAHQWRQPLNVISFMTMNLGLQYKFGTLNEDALTQLLLNIDSQTQKMSSIISDFLGFFKPSKSKERFFIEDTFDGILGIIGKQLSGRDISVEVRADIRKEFYGFKNELEQVILNIVVNARDAFASRPDSTHKTISVNIRHIDEQILIYIADNAGGIDEAIIKRVFEPYFTTKEDGGGTGIGLYMSRLIMQKSFNGDVSVNNIYDSNSRVGAEFILRINNLKEENQIDEPR